MTRSTRRGFVQQSAALTLGLTTGLTGKTLAANDKISVACIGVRGRGNSVMHSSPPSRTAPSPTSATSTSRRGGSGERR